MSRSIGNMGVETMRTFKIRELLDECALLPRNQDTDETCENIIKSLNAVIKKYSKKPDETIHKITLNLDLTNCIYQNHGNPKAKYECLICNEKYVKYLEAIRHIKINHRFSQMQEFFKF